MTENNTPPTPPEGVTVTNSPVPTPATSVPSTTVSESMPNMESGGATNITSSWNEFLKSLNIIEVGFMILGATSLYFIIYYYNRRAMSEKSEMMDIQKQLDEIKMNLRSSMKEKYKNI
jgi:hypothetical protein